MPSVNITFTIPQKLLAKIEQNITGKSRSGKIKKCLIEGYQIITSEPTLRKGKPPALL